MNDIIPAVDPQLARYRDQYPILADSVYLNSNSMGAMPTSTRAAATKYLDTWQQEGVEAWDIWAPLVTEIGDKAAKFIGGAPGCTSLGQNVAGFQAAVASCLDFSGKRNKVVSEALMFPNVLYVWERFCELGADLQLVPSEDGINIPTERILDAIDERTAIVTLSHAVYVSGALLDITAICERAREVGALTMIDVYQTAGALPIDAQAWGADFVVGGSHKWLCGGPGTCFLYVRPDLDLDLRPRTTGWMAHADPFAFEPAPIRLAQTPWRMMSGTPSIPAFYMAGAAYDNLLEVGMPRIRAHNLALARRIIERAQAADLTVNSPLQDATRTGFVAVDFPGSQEASRTLISERYKHDWRPNCGLRLGPHFYNTLEDVDRFMDRVVELAGRT